MPVALALVLAGCGGASTAGETSRPATEQLAGVPAPDGARPAFAERVDAICAQANRKESELGALGPGWMYEQQFDDVEFLVPFTDAGRTALRKLERVAVPASERDAMTTMLDAIGRMVAALDSRVDVLRDGRQESSAVREYESAYTDLVTAAGQLELTECQGILL